MIDKIVEKIRADFISSQEVLLAIGHETRQNIILALMEAPCKVGMRVGEITARTHLSRPAVSHHLKILKDAKIVSLRNDGTKNYYAINRQGGLKEGFIYRIT